jgi:hypothetical protein
LEELCVRKLSSALNVGRTPQLKVVSVILVGDVSGKAIISRITKLMKTAIRSIAAIIISDVRIVLVRLNTMDLTVKIVSGVKSLKFLRFIILTGIEIIMTSITFVSFVLTAMPSDTFERRLLVGLLVFSCQRTKW